MSFRIVDIHDQDVQSDLHLIRTTGIPPGVDLGFETFREHWNWKKKQSCFIYGAPGAGKSTLSNYLDVLVSHLHGWKHTIFTPEMGTHGEYIASLVQIVLGQNEIRKDSKFGVDPVRWEQALEWVRMHFRIVTDVEGQEDVYAACDLLHHEQAFESDCVTLDPFNKLRHKTNGQPKDEYLQEWLHTFNGKAISANRFQKVCVHPINMNHYKEEVEMSNGEKELHFKPVQKDQIMWGQEWDRQAYQMVSVWRPKQYLKDGSLISQIMSNGNPYPEGYVEVSIQKVKQKSTGKVSTHSLVYDWKTCRYYEYDISGNRVDPLESLKI